MNISRANKTIGHSFAGHPWWLAEPLENRQFYDEVVKPKLWPHQRLMVVPGLYGNNSFGVPQAARDLHDTRLVAKLNACELRHRLVCPCNVLNTDFVVNRLGLDH